MTWNEGYVTEIDYTRGYYRELSPVLQTFALLNKGFRAPTSPDLKYLELGFGHGLSLNVHAASCSGEFWGTDFNPVQVSGASEEAELWGTNARLFDQSFSEFAARTDLPQFDFINLHGIWSWISSENQQTLIEIFRRHLKPGGVVYMSYNVLPGWAAAGPISHLLRLHAGFAGDLSAPVTSRVDAAFQFAREIHEAGGGYFHANPGMKARLDRLSSLDKVYLAHEHLNQHWHPMYFSDVARLLEPAKLTFAASAGLLEQVEALQMTDSARKMLDNIEQTVFKESIRDYFVNQQFRRDLWTRGARKLTSAERSDALMAQRFVLLSDPSTIPMEVTRPLGKATLEEAIYKPLIEQFAINRLPISIAELVTKLRPHNIDAPKIHNAITILVGSGHLAPTQNDAAIDKVSRRCRNMNKYLCTTKQNQLESAMLASPVTGTAIKVSAIQRLCLQSRLSGRKKPHEWADDINKALTAANQSITKDGKAIEKPDELAAELLSRATAFADQHLPVLERLGVIPH